MIFITFFSEWIEWKDNLLNIKIKDFKEIIIYINFIFCFYPQENCFFLVLKSFLLKREKEKIEDITNQLKSDKIFV